MDLKTGQLLWPAMSAAPMGLSPLQNDLRCQVLVIGSGVTGAFCAALLSQAGMDVALVDRREAVSGSTPASTAMVMYDIDLPLVQLGERIGFSDAQRAYLRSYRAVRDFGSVVESLEDHAGMTPRPCVYLATREGDCAMLQEEADARREIGIDARFIDAAELKSTFMIQRPGAVVSSRALTIDPYRLTISLLKSAMRRGVRVFPQTQVRLIDSGETEVHLRSEQGHQIAASHVIFATGYETPEMLRGDYCQLKSTYALATQPLLPSQLWRSQPLIWEHKTPYFYARTTPDGRILCGGEDEDFASPELRDSLLDIKTETLLARLQSLAPWLDPRADFFWAGTFAETRDGLPIIGSVPHLANCHFALGYGGNGLTFSLIAAQVIREGILGGRDEDADLFCFERASLV